MLFYHESMTDDDIEFLTGIDARAALVMLNSAVEHLENTYCDEPSEKRVFNGNDTTNAIDIIIDFIMDLEDERDG